MNDGTIHPVFDYRFSMDEIRGYYSTLEDALRAGDYNLVATYAPEGSVLQGCALVLSGLYVRGLPILERHRDLGSFALLCLAFGQWTADRSADALATLARVAPGDAPHHRIATRLAELIRRPSINVFTVSVTLPIFRGEAMGARHPVQSYGQFQVKYVASQLTENAYPEYSGTQPLDRFIDALPEAERPLFIFSMSPQCILPKNYEKASVPKVMWCHDTDIFLYRGFENFQTNDVNIVAMSQEHFELSRGLGTRIVSNMMSETLCMPLQRATPAPEKDIDILFTGSALSRFHSEKSRFMYHMAQLGDEFTVKIVEGHLPEEEYHALLRRTRFLPIVNRYAGVTSPRWREALSAGAFLLYPEGTPFGLFPGAFSYRHDSITDDLRRHLRAERDTGTRAGSPYNMGEVFPRIEASLSFLSAPRPQQMERLLRFCTFSILLRDLHQPAPCPPSARRRLSWYVPGIDRVLWGADVMKERVLELANAGHDTELVDDKDYALAAAIYKHLDIEYKSEPAEREAHNNRVSQLLEAGLRRFPNSLLLHFNRAHWLFMDDVYARRPVRTEAVRLFKSIIDNFATLDFDPEGSDPGIPFTAMYSDLVFPYYDYGQLIVQWAVQRTTPDHPAHELVDPRSVLRAACHGYLGWAKLHLCAPDDADTVQTAIAHLEDSLDIYEDNLPVKRLAFRSLAGLPGTRTDKALARQVVDAFFRYAGKYPAALIMDINLVLPPMALLGDEAQLRRLLADWYAFYRTVSFTDNSYAPARMKSLEVVMRHRELLPEHLNEWYEDRKRNGADIRALPQQERDLYLALVQDDWRRIYGVQI